MMLYLNEGYTMTTLIRRRPSLPPLVVRKKEERKLGRENNFEKHWIKIPSLVKTETTESLFFRPMS